MHSGSQSFLLVVNPTAAAGRARERMTEVVSALREARATFETVVTRGPGEATTLVRDALLSGAGGIAVVGGDGTLNEAVNGFFDAKGEPVAPDAWLGPLPCGTGGDFRRVLDIPKDPSAMVTRMMWATPRRIDVGAATYRKPDGAEERRLFLNIASAGLAGEVDAIVNKGKKWLGGMPTFMMGTLRALSRYELRRVRVTLDEGAPSETEVLNVAVANGRYFGGGMQIAPSASLEDGLFDVITVEGLGLVDQARMLRHLYRGTVLECEGIRHARAKRVRLEPGDWKGPVLLDVDGEQPGVLPATMEILEGALPLRA